MKNVMVLLILMGLTACSQMYFDKGTAVADSAQRSQSQWHHNSVFALVEVSDPVDVRKTCDESQWESVKTETSFLNGVVRAVPYVSIFWAPETVTVQCQGGSASN